MVLEAIGIFAAKRIYNYAEKKGIEKLTKNRNSFESNLSAVIQAAMKRYEKTYPIPVAANETAFYQSQLLIDHLLQFRFFGDNAELLNKAFIQDVLKTHPNIILPKKIDIQRFLTFFDEELAQNQYLKKLEIRENYQSEIFNISQKIDLLLEKVFEKPKLSKYLTAVTTIKERDILGRKKDLQNVRDLLVKDNEAALINGMGGIGKTTLAAVYAEAFQHEYDHIAWFTIEENLEIAIGANRSFLRNLSLENSAPETVLEDSLNALRSIESEKPALLILDNATEKLSKHYQHLPKAPDWHILITSREKISHFKHYDLDFLELEDAKALFTKFCKKFSDADVETLVTNIERHTLTIELLAKAAQRNRWTFTNAKNALKTDAKANVKDVKHAGKKVERIKGYLCSIFVTDGLSENEIVLLKQFTALPNEYINYAFLQDLLQVDKLDWQDDFTDVLENLHEKGYLRKNQTDDSYNLHPILQEVLGTQLQPSEDDVEQLLERVTGLLSIDQSKDNPIDKFKFVPFGDALLDVLGKSESKNISLLKNELANVYRNLGEYQKARDLLEAALKNAIENFGEKHPTVAVSQSNLANVYRNLGEYQKARDLLEAALKNAIENFGEKHPSVAVSQSNLANVYRNLGEYQKARDLLEAALKNAIENFGEKHPTVAVSQSNLANVFYNTGDKNRAKALWENAYQTFLNHFGENHPHTLTVKQFLDEYF